MSDASWRRLVRRRLAVVLVLLGAWGVTIQGRLLQVQVVQHERHLQRALTQQEGTFPIVAPRGDIYDRNGELLAYSVGAWSLAADPSLMEDREAAVAAICEALADCATAERRELARKFNTDARWVGIRKSRHLSPDQVARLDELDERWMLLTEESRRYYPHRELAAQVLGFVGDENRGMYGLEARLEDVIGGQPGVMHIRKDAHASRLMAEVRQPAVPGASVELTIDEGLQYIAERELLRGVAEAKAEAGTVVVLETATGAIRALASYPTFNPNDYRSDPQETWSNKALQNVYEPGSTFKIVTISAALEQGLFAPDDIIDIRHGRLPVPGRGKPIIDDHVSSTLMSFEDVIVKSSNVGAVLIGQRAGKELITRYAQRFGFGQTISTDFAGESAGVVYSAAGLNDSGLASMSMGYQVSVTPLQMVSAMNAVANGGRLMQPQLVRAIIHQDGTREETQPKMLRQVIRPETAETMIGFLEQVVGRGTARAAQLDGFLAAGKTGTAKKAVPGGYSETDRIASFVGFAPSRRPEFTILVLIDTPRNGQVYGGALAAPVFKRIADAALLRSGTTPTVNAEPPVMMRATDDMSSDVLPAAFQTSPVRFNGNQSTMPDLRGMSGRDATAVLRELGLTVKVTGNGSVAVQVPAPGEPLEPGDFGALELRRGARPPGNSGGGRQ